MMKLKKVQIENFKCIEDSQEFEIDQVTCLMGKNEAGKTAILEALYKLNPVEEEKADFDELEYPRRYVTTYRQRSKKTPANVITSKWEIELEDLEFLNNLLGNNIIKDPEAIITKGYDNELLWTVKIDEKQYIKDFLTPFKLNASEHHNFKNLNQ